MAVKKVDDVLEWRLDQLKKLGFSKYQRGILVDKPGLDVGEIRECIAKGCTPFQAWRIFKP